MPDWREHNKRAKYKAKAALMGETKYREGPGLPDATSVLLAVTTANAFRLGHTVPLYRSTDGKPITVAGRHVGRAEHALYNTRRTDYGVVRRHLKRGVRALERDHYPIPEAVVRLLRTVEVLDPSGGEPVPDCIPEVGGGHHTGLDNRG